LYRGCADRSIAQRLYGKVVRATAFLQNEEMQQRTVDTTYISQTGSMTPITRIRSQKMTEKLNKSMSLITPTLN